MPGLIALDIGPSDRFVSALGEVWDRGDTALPIDPRLPDPVRKQLLAALKPTELWSVSRKEVLLDGEETEPGDALVVATSGTTGDPKGVVLTMAAVRAAAAITSDALEVDLDTDRWLLCLPVAHMGGLSVVTRSLITGVPIIALPGIEKRAVESAAGRGATLTSLVPAALKDLDVSRFRKVLLGGSAIPANRPSNAIATYGLTESAGGVVYDGRSLPGVELRIDDGEIVMRSPTLLRTYRLADDPKSSDGWLPTGDLGQLSDDGTLTVHGRKDELIISGGHNVFPGHVERALASHPEIADVAVAGRPSEKWGTAVTAIVVPTDGANPPTLDSLRGWAKARLPFYAAPTAVELVASIPRTAIGKINRSAL